MNLIDILQNQKEALDQADSILAKATQEGRELTASEKSNYDGAMVRNKHLAAQADERQATNTLRQIVGGKFPLLAVGGVAPARHGQTQMSTEYTESFLAFLRSGGKQASSALSEGFDPMFGGFALPALPGMSAALYESSPGAGGYTTTAPTDPNIIPLATPDLGVRSLARVITTANDIKLPSQSTFGAAGMGCTLEVTNLDCPGLPNGIQNALSTPLFPFLIRHRNLDSLHSQCPMHAPQGAQAALLDFLGDTIMVFVVQRIEAARIRFLP